MERIGGVKNCDRRGLTYPSKGATAHETNKSKGDQGLVRDTATCGEKKLPVSQRYKKHRRRSENPLRRRPVLGGARLKGR